MVVLHGTSWSSFDMRHLIQTLSTEHSVYYHGMAGYGLSSKGPGDASLGVQNALLAELLAHWGLASPAVVDHDFNGTTLLRAHLPGGSDFSRIVSSASRYCRS